MKNVPDKMKNVPGKLKFQPNGSIQSRVLTGTDLYKSFEKSSLKFHDVFKHSKQYIMTPSMKGEMN